MNSIGIGLAKISCDWLSWLAMHYVFKRKIRWPHFYAYTVVVMLPTSIRITSAWWLLKPSLASCRDDGKLNHVGCKSMQRHWCSRQCEKPRQDKLVQERLRILHMEQHVAVGVEC